jgi:ABC-type multidrug transport system ATPase subunit
VLLISSELPEVIATSDRIIVMSDGQVAGTLEPRDFSEERILRLAVFGGKSEGSGGNSESVEPREGGGAP